MRRVFFMPFGKHKGKSLADVPGQYLAWLLREADIDRNLALNVAAELERRQAERDDIRRRATRERDHEPGSAIVDVPAILKRWFRGASMRYHPDRGGSHEVMVAINAEYQALRELFGLAEQGAT